MKTVFVLAVALLVSAPAQADIASARTTLFGGDPAPALLLARAGDIPAQLALMRLEKVARQGGPESQMQYGAALANGIDGTSRPGDGLAWIVRAADHGYVEALMTLGAVSLRGNFGDPDTVVAYKWCGLAANLGDERAMGAVPELESQMIPVQIAEGRKLVRECTPK